MVYSRFLLFTSSTIKIIMKIINLIHCQLQVLAKANYKYFEILEYWDSHTPWFFVGIVYMKMTTSRAGSDDFDNIDIPTL